MLRQSAWQIPQSGNDQKLQKLMKAWQHAFAYTEGYYPSYKMHNLLSYSPYKQNPQLLMCNSSDSVSLLITD